MSRRARKYRIGLTCDFYRFVPAEHEVTNFQNRNLSWLNELLRVGLSNEVDAKLTVISANQDTLSFKKILGNTKVYAKYLDDPETAWAQLYEYAGHDVFSVLLDRLSRQDLVIGFEIPPTLRRHLHANKQRYINFYIHPVRFLQDLCFGATTNCPAVASLLQANQCAQIEITRQVRRYSGLFSRLQLPACSLPVGLPVLIGQTARDSVLISKGVFANWENYRDVLVDELAPFDTVVFLEHPYRPNSAIVIEYLRGSLRKNVISVRGNSYGLMFSNHEIPIIITLCSSLGVEAEVIGHHTKFLLSDPRAKFLIPEIEQPMMPMLGHAVLDAKFWNAVVNGEHAMHINPEIKSFFMGDHYLRNSLDAWSYRSLQYALVVEPSVKTIVPAPEVKQKRLHELAAECCGIRYREEKSKEQLTIIARSQGIDLRLLDKPLVPGEKRVLPVNTDEGAHYLCKGFHQPENWGVWSSERCSILVIPLVAKSELRAYISIELEIRVFEGAGKGSPVLKLSTETQDIGYVFFRSPSLCLQKVAFNVLTPPPALQLYFEQTDLRSPYETHGGADTRLLGFGLSRVSVHYHLEPWNATIQDGNECQFWGIDPVNAIKCSSDITVQTP